MGKIDERIKESQRMKTANVMALITGLQNRDPNLPAYDETKMLAEMELTGDDFAVMRKWTYYQLGVDPSSYNATIEYLIKQQIKDHHCYIDENNKIKHFRK